ncbi:MAG: TIGR03546 family protein [Elusimicrobia bacterium]|nr:TIGR03546 family protein [Elusimicrobiota bacterium]
MNPLGLIRQFIKGLTTETEPPQIAAGVALGFLIGLLPKATLTVQLLLVLVMALRVNFPIALLAICATMPLNPLLDRLTDPLGYALLSAPALAPLWTQLYNMPVMPWTGFNNTVLLGGLVLGLALFAPVYFAARKGAAVYNERFKAKVMNSKLVKGLKGSWLFDWYFKEI